MPSVQDARWVAEHFYEAWNAHDLETCFSLLHDDVQLTIDTHVIIGRQGAVEYAADLLRALPGTQATLERLLVVDPGCVVCELRLAHPLEQLEAAMGQAFRSGMRVCTIVEARSGQIASLRSYRAAEPDGHGTAPLPSRHQVVRPQAEQAAAARIARLQAVGAPPLEVFAAVNEELVELVAADAAWLIHFGSDDDLSILSVWGPRSLTMPVGTRHALGAEMRAHRDRAQPYRFQLEESDGGPSAVEARRLGLSCSVGVPIVVDGRVWGLSVAALLRPGSLSAQTESLMTGFIELVATTVSNAQARADLQLVGDEQAALRRVATLAAAGRPGEEIVAAVAEESSTLLGGHPTTLSQYDDDGSTIVVVAASGDHVPVGMSFPVAGEGVAAVVRRSGAPARIDDYVDVPGTTQAYGIGIRATVAVPVTVDGRLWGLLIASSADQPLPPGTEARLSQFAAIVAASIFSAKARDDLAQLALERGALLRVAELVAHGVDQDTLFQAVALEAAGLVGDEATTLIRYEGGRTFTILATHGGPASPGTRVVVPDDDRGTMDEVLRTGRPSRLDDYGKRGGPLFSQERYGVGSSVTVPIKVDGRLWGMMGSLNEGRPLPPETEDRMEKFAALAAVAIANAENKAKLTASRARVVASADEARHRLQRDVHDGAQQWLVQTVLALQLATAAAAEGLPTDELLLEALRYAIRANTDLRGLVHGILPASLTRYGLQTGLESLIADLAVPVDLDVPAGRLPAQIETTAYFIVAEALTNVVKHAGAERAGVLVNVDDSVLTLVITDDGVGGADPSRGSGLTGLIDRVDAAVGTLVLESQPGNGTTIRVTLPLPLADARPADTAAQLDQ